VGDHAVSTATTSAVRATAGAGPVRTDRPDEPCDPRAFERWGIAAYLALTALLVMAVVVWLHGRFVYVIDDPAIHLGMADTLVHHGTWGVAAGHFQSASSSPLWTLLMAAGIGLSPVGDEWVPLVLNLAAGVGVVVVLGRSQALLTPTRRRRLDVVAVAVVVVVALFLPGLALVGMEHTLHLLLVLAAVVAVERRLTGPGADPGRAVVDPRRGRWFRLAPYGLLALATLTRFETAFVGVGLAVGIACVDGSVRRAVRRHGRLLVGVLAAVGVPLVLFAVANKAMGGGFLPNSVLAKAQGIGTSSTATGLSPQDVAGRLRRDPLLVALLALAVGYVALTWGRPVRHRLVAATLAVASLLHVTLADVGWHERYQAYLVLLGVYLVLGVAAELPADVRSRAVAAVVALALLLTVPKANLLAKTAVSADNIARHQYPAGQFLARYYDGRAVATDQLGYISWFHDGPLTDLAGLGDYEVLERDPGSRDERAELWASLARERGFRVAVTFADIVATNAPDTWVYVGQFCKSGYAGNGYDRCFAFWATDPDEVAPLRQHLSDYEPELPARTYLEINAWADWQADEVRAAAGR
jgi:hypothetical protein